jgi:hypothetical protein
MIAAPVLRGIRRLGRAEPLGDLGVQPRGTFFHTPVAIALCFEALALILVPDERHMRHMPELDETCLLAQLQNLPEQFAKRPQVTLAEIRYSADSARPPQWRWPDTERPISAA